MFSPVLLQLTQLKRKLHFVYVYTAPFRITWGSVTHAVVQIACIPRILLPRACSFLCLTVGLEENRFAATTGCCSQPSNIVMMVLVVTMMMLLLIMMICGL